MKRVDFITHRVCRACESPNLELLIDFGNMPLAGGFLRPEEVDTVNIAFPLRLGRCCDCTVMQVLDTIPPEMIFSQYSYTSSTTETLVDHFEEMAGEIVERHHAKGRLVVEFGCNDGILVRPLIRRGACVIGVDPSDVAARASQGQGWTLIQGYFDEAIASQILQEYGPARIIVGNNVFAHVEDIHAFLKGVIALLDSEGVFIFEVHYQGDLVKLVQFDTVYHEHHYYFSVTSLVKLLGKHGLHIIDVERISIHAGSIRVTAARAYSPHSLSSRVEELLEEEKRIDISGFIKQVSNRRDRMRTLVFGLRKAGKRIAAYGASGRMTIMLNYCGFGSNIIDYVVDMSPLRFGKLVLGVLIPIVPPDAFHANPPDYAIMTAWNYEKEILEKEREFLKNGGRFIVPLPEIRILQDAAIIS